jgi:hypothetical protein
MAVRYTSRDGGKSAIMLMGIACKSEWDAWFKECSEARISKDIRVFALLPIATASASGERTIIQSCVETDGAVLPPYSSLRPTP